MIGEIEAAIVSHLSRRIQGWSVVALANPKDLERVTQNKQIFVVFRRESLDTPVILNNSHPITQNRTIEFDVLIQSTDLRSHQGVYGAIDQVRELLTGLVPTPQAKAMFEISAQLISSAEGVWLYGMTFSCKFGYQKRRQ